MSRLIVSFNGWVECDPAKTTFTNMDIKNGHPEQITGEDWMELEEEDQLSMS